MNVTGAMSFRCGAVRRCEPKEVAGLGACLRSNDMKDKESNRLPVAAAGSPPGRRPEYNYCTRNLNQLTRVYRCI
jgi:hypothetical protein